MIRKLWIDIRAMFLLSATFLVLLTVIYSGVFATTSIFEYTEYFSYGLHASPGEELPKLMAKHPTGRLFSLKETPESYLVGFDAIARFVFPWLVLFLCVGGILTETSTGSTSFDLSFPPSRSEWIWRRAGLLLGAGAMLAILDCAVALAFNLWMGLAPNIGHLAVSLVQLTLTAIPVIGLSLWIQSWFTGRFSDPTVQAVLPFTLAAIVVTAVQVPGYILLSVNPVEWVLGAVNGMNSPVSIPWITLAVAVICGAGGILLATRRFQKLDF